MVPSVLYVTSFANDMYEATGRKLIETFLHTQSEGKLLCCTESVSLGVKDPRLLVEDLSSSEFLKSWLISNRDIIPIHLGGMAGPCGCIDQNPRAKTHKRGCPGTWFNRNASRWFRKIASLEIAIKKAKDVLVWLDSDCYFRRQLKASPMLGMFGTATILYLKSPDRLVPETGIMGFRPAFGGKIFLESLFNRYRSGEFRKDERWDDSYQFLRTLASNPEIPSVDIAKRASGHADVVRHSPIGVFIEHRKGHHGRGLKIMT